MRKTINGSPGLYTAANAELLPAGSLSVAKGVVIRRPGLIQKARPFRQYTYGGDSVFTDPTTGTTRGSYGFNYFSGRFYIQNQDGEVFRDNASGVFADTGYRVLGGGTSAKGPRQTLAAAEGNNNFYMLGLFRTSASATLGAVAKVDATAGTLYAAGCPRALDPILSALATGTLLASGQSRAYRAVWKFIDANGNLILGAPSGPVTFTATGAQDVAAKVLMPADIYNAANATSYRVQLYASNIVASGSNPDDELQLVADYGVTATDVTNKYVTINDATPDNLKGILGSSYLYTNPSQQTIAAANYAPPVATDIALFKGSMFYASTTQKHRAFMTMLATPEVWAIQQIQANTPGAGQSTYTFLAAVDLAGFDATCKLAVTGTAANDGTWPIVSVNNGAHTVVVTNAGVAAAVAGSAISGKLTVAAIDYFPIFGTESVANKYYTVPSTGTSQAKVSAAAQSLVRIVNQQTAATVVAYNTTNPLGPAGEISLEEKSIGGAAFTATALGTTTAGYRGAYSTTFAPAIPATTPLTSLNDAKKNRLHFSKTGQPEHCPLSDSFYFDIGSASKAILRIISLRNALLVFKEDGLFRVTGDAGVFAWAPFDQTQVLIRATLAEPILNTAVAVTGRGVWQFSEVGARYLSGPVEDKINQLTSGASSTRNVAITGSPSSLSVNETDAMVHVYAATQATTASDACMCLTYSLTTGAWTEQYASAEADGVTGQVDFASFNFIQVNGARYGIARSAALNPTADFKTYDIYIEDQFVSPPKVAFAGVTCDVMASDGEPATGHKYFISVTAVTSTTITATVLSGATIVVGDAIVASNAAAFWVTAVNGSVLTLSLAYGSGTVSGSFAAVNKYVHVSKQPVQVDYNPYTAGEDGEMKEWGEVVAVLDPLSTTTASAVSVGCYTENWPAASMTMQAVPTAGTFNRIGVEGSATLARRLAVRVTHSNPLEYFYLRGISYLFEPQPDSIAIT